MDQARFLRVKELFQLALGWPAEERGPRLQAACAGDDELRAEVQELVDHAAAAGPAFLAASSSPPGVPFPAAVLAIPGFRVLDRLAAGSSGTVYRAEQHSPRREVALKVLRLDALAAGLVARFEREAAILAGLDHPGIARVIQAGVLVDGTLRLPWIALEFVRGSLLDEFVRDRRPSLPALLELFAEVCDAVEHAHARGIVHRDLKPSNVMIDESGRPRVLDFGVARAGVGAPSGPAADATDPTRTGMLIGTLAYMAPEQARGARALGPSADVYGLGALLFELLTGLPPVPLDELDLVEAVQAVCEQEPTPLRRLRPDLPRDLETILSKALAKEPERRYARAGELAADLRRLLAHRPVLARPATAAYQARKLVRRHRAMTLATLAVVLALALGLAFALASLRVANRELAVSSEVIELFAATMLELTPKLGFGEEERGDLEVLLGLVERQLEAVPGSRGLRAARARLCYELASLDQARAAFPEMRLRLEVARAVCAELTREDPADIESWTRLSQVYAKLGEAAYGEGELAARDRWFAEALALDERLVREHPGVSELVEDLGWSLERVAMAAAERGDHAEAERLHLRRLADAEPLVQREPDNWKYLYNLTHAHHFAADIHHVRAEHEAASWHTRECVRIAERLHELQPDRRDFLTWLTDVCRIAGGILQAAGAHEEARDFAEKAVTHAETLVLGDPRRADHLFVLCMGVTELAMLLRESGESEPLSTLAARLRRTLHTIRPSGAPLGLTRLEGLAEELEAEARAAAR